jgi:KR domain
VPAAGALVRPPEAAVWGLARVIMTEHPEWGCRLVDLDEGADAAERLLAECLQPGGENQLAWRGGQRLAARLEPLALAAGPAVPVRADGAYLVTGGLGALGLLTADWLVRRGARRLVLVGRTAASPAAQARLAAWEAAGVTVTAAAADVSDRGALAALLAGLAADGATLRGIVHAAGVLDDGVLRQQTLARFARVLGAKANGARHLDELTRAAPLDFFILFSSAAAVLGTPGQAN